MGRVERLSYVDGLRAVGVLSVVATHLGSYTKHDNNAFWVLAHEGHHGVDLFFVISGFCLSRPFLVKIRDAGMAAFNVALFAAKRVVRILPPYWAAILIFAVIGPDRAPLGDVLRQAIFLDKDTQMLSGSFWSLAVEFRWYFFFPFALLLWVRAPRAFLAAICILYLSQATRSISIDTACLHLFMLGIVAADVSLKNPRWARMALPLALGLLTLGLISSPPGDNTIPNVFWNMGVFLLVVAAGTSKALRSLLSLPLIVTIGVASYSIYLMNGPIIVLLSHFVTAPSLVGLGTIFIGLAFWLIAERPFVETGIRDLLLHPATDVASRSLNWLRITSIVTLSILRPLRIVEASTEFEKQDFGDRTGTALTGC